MQIIREKKSLVELKLDPPSTNGNCGTCNNY
jgi:hypothetical protein